jgi:DNA-binding transcriptional LysR family regulator
MIEEISGDLLQWLRGFYFVAERGGVTQAAIVMGREQPTITRQIQCLEKELGVTLFDRSSGKMKLTPEGKKLLEEAVSLFEHVKEIRTEFRNPGQQYQGTIVVATSHAIIYSFLPKYILDFRKSYPRVHFHLVGGVYETVFDKLDSGEADFGIAFADPIPKGVVSFDLFQTGQKLITPKKHSFFRGKSPTLKQIAQIPLILFSLTGSIEPFIEKRFSQERLKPNVVMTHNNFVSVKRYVSLGVGAGLLNGYAITEEDEESFEIYSLDRFFPKRKIGLLFKTRKYLSPAVKAFIRTIKPEIQFPK